MALYVDSADRSAIEPLLATGLFAGITTNPTLLARSGLSQQDLGDLYGWASAHGAGTVFMQVLGQTAEHMLANGRQLRNLGDDVVVKLPATRAGLTATRWLSDQDIPCLVTAVYHPAQGLLADAAGARYIAPYVGRMTDHGRDGVASTELIRSALTSRDSRTRVLVASLRTAADVAALAAFGVEDFALNPELAAAMLVDDLTVQAAADFETAAREPA